MVLVMVMVMIVARRGDMAFQGWAFAPLVVVVEQGSPLDGRRRAAVGRELVGWNEATVD